MLLLVFPLMVLAVEPLPKNLISLESEQGIALLKRDAGVQTVKLLSHFTTQQTNTYCGVASAVMVLNASGLKPPADSMHPPYYYFNQQDFFTDVVKKIVSPDVVLAQGLTLRELSAVIGSYGLNAQAYPANTLDLKSFRALMIKALEDGGYIIANFYRPNLKQQGGGHHSPVAAYDAATDRFLVLDVARFKYPAFWVSTESLWGAVNTRDGVHYRGVVVV